VLTRGWAYGSGGTALAGKDCLWVSTTGGTPETYAIEGAHQRAFTDFVAPIEQTARFCGMTWLPPVLLHGAHVISEDELSAMAATLRQRVVEWQQQQAGAGNAD
jgi:glutathione-regulated potassium-efflux system ancillary protein KefF